MQKLVEKNLSDDPVYKKMVARREKAAKASIKRSGMQFNFDFQPQHKGRGQPGHWKDFVAAVAGLKDIHCSICIGLLEKYKIDRVGSEEEISAAQEAAVVAVATREAQQRFMDGDNVDSPPKKRQRAGRPKKSPPTEGEEQQQEVKFNLWKYLEAKRPNMYRFLSPDEAFDRLSEDKKQMVGAIEMEMKKHPVQCRCCGVFFHLPYASNNIALHLATQVFWVHGNVTFFVVVPGVSITWQIIKKQ